MEIKKSAHASFTETKVLSPKSYTRGKNKKKEG